MRKRGIRNETTRIVNLGRCPRCDTVRPIGMRIACDVPYALTCECGRHYVDSSKLSGYELRNCDRLALINAWNREVLAGLPNYIEND